MSNFGDSLKAERTRAGLTQKEAAKYLSLKDRTYWDWEANITTPVEVAQEGALARMKKLKTKLNARAMTPGANEKPLK